MPASARPRAGGSIVLSDCMGRKSASAAKAQNLNRVSEHFLVCIKSGDVNV